MSVRDRAPLGVAVFCSALALAALGLLAVAVVRGNIWLGTALALVAVVAASALGVSLFFGRRRVRMGGSMWEMVPPWVVLTLAAERLIGPTAGLAAILLYPAALIGLRLVAPQSWVRAGSR